MRGMGSNSSHDVSEQSNSDRSEYKILVAKQTSTKLYSYNAHPNVGKAKYCLLEIAFALLRR